MYMSTGVRHPCPPPGPSNPAKPSRPWTLNKQVCLGHMLKSLYPG